ncbi:MAG: hypothetical protein ACF8R9_09555, partial [Phycisphaerales bacterium JB054]
MHLTNRITTLLDQNRARSASEEPANTPRHANPPHGAPRASEGTSPTSPTSPTTPTSPTSPTTPPTPPITPDLLTDYLLADPESASQQIPPQ